MKIFENQNFPPAQKNSCSLVLLNCISFRTLLFPPHHLSATAGPAVQHQADFVAQLARRLAKAVVYKDAHVLCFNKWAGLNIQGDSEGRSLARALRHLKLSGDDQLRIIHRLDKNTTGLCLVARSPAAAAVLHQAMGQGQIKKTYWGLTLGVPHPQRGVVDQRIGRRPGAQHMSCLLQDEAEAQLMKSTLVPATTRYKVLKHCDTHVALVEFQPLTGRRHQIRVHSSQALKCPIVGDDVYGWRSTPWLRESLRSLPGLSEEMPLMLHARGLHIRNYRRLMENVASNSRADNNDEGAEDAQWDKLPATLQLTWPVPSVFRQVLDRLNLRDAEDSRTGMYHNYIRPNKNLRSGGAHTKHRPLGAFRVSQQPTGGSEPVVVADDGEEEDASVDAGRVVVVGGSKVANKQR